MTVKDTQGGYSAAELVVKPEFWSGLSQEAQDLLTVHEAIPEVVHYLADIRHWILIQMAIALHFEYKCDPSRPRLSPKVLQEALEGTRIASRNTIQTFLREMVRVQLTDQPLPETLRQRAPQVSEKSEKLILVYLSIHLRALDAVDGGRRNAALQNRPDLLPALQSRFARRICLSPAWYNPSEEVRCFTGSTSGSSILHDLILATQHRQPDAAGRIWIGPISSAQFSGTYNVSTAHVARMLSKAQTIGAVGWAKPRRRGDCWLSVKLARSYLLWQAEKLSALSRAFEEIWMDRSR